MKDGEERQRATTADIGVTGRSGRRIGETGPRAIAGGHWAIGGQAGRFAGPPPTFCQRVFASVRR